MRDTPLHADSNATKGVEINAEETTATTPDDHIEDDARGGNRAPSNGATSAGATGADENVEETAAEATRKDASDACATHAGGDADADAEVRELKEQVTQLTAQLTEAKNQQLRAQADLENFRRRTRKEKEELLKYAALPVVKGLLPALDNLERAIAAGKDANATDASGLLEGVKMVNRQILDILAAEGLAPIAAVGEPFNPEFHEAVMQVASDEHEPGIVVEEFQKGYQLKDRVIRPAMVKVSN